MGPLSSIIRVRSALACVALVASVSSGVATAAPAATVTAPESGDTEPQPLPGPVLDEPFELRGAAAVKRLEALGQTAEVAANGSLTASELVEELRADPLIFVTSEGMVGYTEPVAGAGAADETTQISAEAAGANVFTLNSRPSSTRVVYLDFTGHTTVGDYWNSNYGVEEIVSAPYDLDGDAGTFTGIEQQRIYDIWRVVADDYAPFDVNVTTQDPGVGGLRKTSASDAAYGQRIVITPSDWYYQAAQAKIGGIALLNVFSSSVDHAAFVFSSNLSAGSVKPIAEAASHEAGHSFGLRHDGRGSAGYYSGHGDWAPIMGVGYYRSVTQWSQGEYANATNDEDDLALIQQHTPVAPDDHGNTTGTATPLPSIASTTGQIAVSDVDMFSVTVGAGALTATLTPTGGNLHATVTIKNSLGQVMASGSPASAVGWTAAATTTAPAGTYTIAVAPAGWLTANTGFTSYASLGGYALSVSGAGPGSTTTTPPPPEPDVGSTLTAMTPSRLADTRSGLGGSTRLAAGTQLTVQVAGSNGVPGSATAAVLNLTAVNPGDAGYLSVFPCATGPSDTSAVNYGHGQTIANTSIATLDTDGRACISTSADSDVLVDITGWLAPSDGSRLQPIGPVRVADTRIGLGGSGRLGAGGTLQLDLHAWVGASATAVALNVTVVGASSPGFLTAYPCGATLPATSTVNHASAEIRPNNTIVGLTGDTVCIFSLAEADVLVDLVGGFGPTGLAYVPTSPTRVVDTRDGDVPLPPLTGVEYELGGDSVTPQAAFVNVTAVGHTIDGYTSTFACDARPDTSTLNQFVGQVAANGAIVPATELGTSCAWMLNGGHVAIDLSGWWVP